NSPSFISNCVSLESDTAFIKVIKLSNSILSSLPGRMAIKVSLLLKFLYQKAGVMSAEAQRIAERIGDIFFHALSGNVIQIQFFIRRGITCRGMDKSLLNLLHTGDKFHCSC